MAVVGPTPASADSFRQRCEASGGTFARQVHGTKTCTLVNRQTILQAVFDPDTGATLFEVACLTTTTTTTRRGNSETTTHETATSLGPCIKGRNM